MNRFTLISNLFFNINELNLNKIINIKILIFNEFLFIIDELEFMIGKEENIITLI